MLTRTSCSAPSSRSAARLKTEVRAEAARRGLAVADKPDSHDICFIADGDTAGFLEPAAGGRGRATSWTTDGVGGRRARAAATSSPSASGAVCGWASRPTDGQPRYVLDISPVDQHGHRRSARRPRGCADHRAIRPTWTGSAAGRRLVRSLAQLRAHGEPLPAGSPRPRRATAVEVMLADPGRPASRPDRPSCSTTTPGWSAARPSPRPPRERARRTGPVHRDRLLARHRHRATRSRSRSPSARSCPTCPSCRRGARTPAWSVGRPPCCAGLAVDLQPAGWRLTDASGREHRLAHQHAAVRPGPARGAGPGLRRARSSTPSPGRGPWPRPWSARAATGCWPTAAPVAISVSRWPRAWPSWSPRCGGGCPRPQPVVQLDEPSAAGRAGRRGGHGQRPVPAPRPSSRRRSATALRYLVERLDRAPQSWCTAAPPTRRSPAAGAPASGASWSTSTSSTGADWDAVGAAPRSRARDRSGRPADRPRC